ncbi:MAG: DegV family EDD domain-containing protein [Clostridiales bacterium]|nr:DegV family EDD domain-containing protein [Clostridiales bacterium]
MIYLVTDSTACITRQEALDLRCVMVPMHYILDGKQAFQEGFIEDSTAIKERQRLHEFSTAQAPTSAFVEVFSQLKEQGHQALCLTISSRLSGTFSNALKAAEEVGGDFLVVDSRTTAGAMYLLLRQARQMLDSGLGLQECFDRLLQLRRQTYTIFTIQDMDPLRRSGRLGYMRSSVSTLLNLRPLLTLQDGSVVSHSLARGKQDQLRQMVLGLHGKPREVIVQHCGDEEAAEALAQKLVEKGIQVMRRQIGIVLAIHLGLPILSTAWLSAQPV